MQMSREVNILYVDCFVCKFEFGYFILYVDCYGCKFESGYFHFMYIKTPNDLE